MGVTLNDAHFFGGIVFDMYNDWIGTPPLTFQLVMQVHYQSNYENAFWNGSRMTFGDGDSMFYPLVDLNVVSHEVSHGFTEQNSDLIYDAQSGGLNEAFSDMAGEAAEYYIKGSNDWYVGAEIMKSGPGLRSMSDPTSLGSIDHANDYISGMDVHYSSGVYNKAFYLLATTVGWNTRTAFEVYTKANQLYWTASTDWNQAGVGVLNAANDLGYNLTEVCTSLNTVGVFPAVVSCPTTPPAPPEPIPTYTILNESGTLTADSENARHRTGSYAEYYTFTLTEARTVHINLMSEGVDSYLFLLDNTDSVISYNDDKVFGNTNSYISDTLEAGTYVLEATSYYSAETGTFTLTVEAEDENTTNNSMDAIISYLLF